MTLLPAKEVTKIGLHRIEQEKVIRVLFGKESDFSKVP